jgi:hypothetical protein
MPLHSVVDTLLQEDLERELRLNYHWKSLIDQRKWP